MPPDDSQSPGALCGYHVQPAERFLPYDSDEPIVTPYWRKWRCSYCGAQRLVRHLVVLVAYDQTLVRCAAGKGCRQ